MGTLETATAEELTQRLYRIGEEKQEVEGQQRELRRLEEEFQTHLQQKNRLLDEISHTWQKGQMAHRTTDRMLQIRKEEQGLMERFWEERETTKKAHRELEAKEEAVYYQRKAAYEKEATS